MALSAPLVVWPKAAQCHPHSCAMRLPSTVPGPSYGAPKRDGDVDLLLYDAVPLSRRWLCPHGGPEPGRTHAALWGAAAGTRTRTPRDAAWCMHDAVLSFFRSFVLSFFRSPSLEHGSPLCQQCMWRHACACVETLAVCFTLTVERGVCLVFWPWCCTEFT